MTQLSGYKKRRKYFVAFLGSLVYTCRSAGRLCEALIQFTRTRLVFDFNLISRDFTIKMHFVPVFLVVNSVREPPVIEAGIIAHNYILLILSKILRY